MFAQVEQVCRHLPRRLLRFSKPPVICRNVYLFLHSLLGELRLTFRSQMSFVQLWYVPFNCPTWVEYLSVEDYMTKLIKDKNFEHYSSCKIVYFVKCRTLKTLTLP